MFSRVIVTTVVTAAMLTIVHANPYSGWAQDGIPIGTVPIFPPVFDPNPEDDDSIDDSLVQFNLEQIELSADVEAFGVEGRLAVRSGLHLVVSGDSPQSVTVPVQLFGETVLGSLEDKVSGLNYKWDGASTGELRIPFGNDRVKGVALVSTGKMQADGSGVTAEIRSVTTTVGEFDLGNDSQFGGEGEITFIGKLLPEVLLVGLKSVSTGEVASYWQKLNEGQMELTLTDVLASTSIEAGFIGSFDGMPTLRVTVRDSWKSISDDVEVQVIAVMGSGNVDIIGENSYGVSNVDDSDTFSFVNISNISRIAIVLVSSNLAEVVDPLNTVVISGDSLATPEPTPTVTQVQAGSESSSERDDGRNTVILLVGAIGVLALGSGVALRLLRSQRAE